MITTTAPRRRAGQRISSALWGVLVAGSGVLMMVSFSGYEVDLELLAIILLASLGGWMLLSAALSGLGRKREVREATAPVEEVAAPDSANHRFPEHAESGAEPEASTGESEPNPVRSEGSANKEVDAGSDDEAVDEQGPPRS